MKEKKSFEVIGVGLAAVDVLWRSPENITYGGKNEVTEMVLQGGAPAGTTTSQLGNLGYSSAFLANLGDNTLSAIAIEEFKRYGVAEDLFNIVPEASPALALCEINSKNAERTVYYNLSHYRTLRKQDIPLDVISKAQLIIIDSFELEAMEVILEAVKGTSVKTVLDLEHGNKDILLRCLKMGTDCILPWEAAQELTGCETPETALNKMAEWTPANLLITDGTRGSWAWAENGIIHQPAFLVDAIDTTGCGDAYHGAYAVGLLEGWDLLTRMEYGAWIAANVATGLGGRTKLPSRDSLASLDLSALSREAQRNVECLIQKLKS
ncbi:carbohydrate kinase family protein [Coraliomargarita sp. W4R53]